MPSVPPEALRNAQLFAGLHPDVLGKVAGAASARDCQAGESVFTEGDPAAGFYVVLKGRVKVVKLGPDGREHILRFVGPGQQFAEAAAFSGQRYPASAQASTDCRLAFFERGRFRRLIADDLDLALSIIVAQADLLRHLVAVVEALALKEVPARVAKYLLDLSVRTHKRGGSAERVRLPLKKGELAARLGTVPETLSRALAKLQAANAIAVEGRDIRILNRERLAEVAAGLKA